MKPIYEASNTIDAHMILNMLENHGIKGQVQGEFLQGGVGELAPTGLVKVLIANSDFDKAKRILEDWEKEQPKIQSSGEQGKSSLGAGFFFLGLVVGVVVTLLVVLLVLS